MLTHTGNATFGEEKWRSNTLFSPNSDPAVTPGEMDMHVPKSQAARNFPAASMVRAVLGTLIVAAAPTAVIRPASIRTVWIRLRRAARAIDEGDTWVMAEASGRRLRQRRE